MATAKIATPQTTENCFELNVPVCKAEIEKYVNSGIDLDGKQFKLKSKCYESGSYPSFHLIVNVFHVIDSNCTFGIDTKVNVEVKHQVHFRKVPTAHFNEIILGFFNDLNSCYKPESNWFVVNCQGLQKIEAYVKPNQSSFTYKQVLINSDPIAIIPEQPSVTFSNITAEDNQTKIQLTLSPQWESLISKPWKTALATSRLSPQIKKEVYLCLITMKHINPEHDVQSLKLIKTGDLSETNANVYLKNGKHLRLNMSLGESFITFLIIDDNNKTTTIEVLHNLLSITGDKVDTVKVRIQKACEFEDECQEDRDQRSGKSLRTLQMERVLSGCEDVVKQDKALPGYKSVRDEYHQGQTASTRGEIFQGNRGMS